VGQGHQGQQVVLSPDAKQGGVGVVSQPEYCTRRSGFPIVEYQSVYCQTLCEKSFKINLSVIGASHKQMDVGAWHVAPKIDKQHI